MAANMGKKVAVFDFVKPTPIGTTWGENCSSFDITSTDKLSSYAPVIEKPGPFEGVSGSGFPVEL